MVCLCRLSRQHDVPPSNPWHFFALNGDDGQAVGALNPFKETLHTMNPSTRRRMWFSHVEKPTKPEDWVSASSPEAQRIRFWDGRSPWPVNHALGSSTYVHLKLDDRD